MGPGPSGTSVENQNCEFIVEAIGKGVRCLWSIKEEGDKPCNPSTEEVNGKAGARGDSDRMVKKAER